MAKKIRMTYCWRHMNLKASSTHEMNIRLIRISNKHLLIVQLKWNQFNLGNAICSPKFSCMVSFWGQLANANPVCQTDMQMSFDNFHKNWIVFSKLRVVVDTKKYTKCMFCYNENLWSTDWIETFYINVLDLDKIWQMDCVFSVIQLPLVWARISAVFTQKRSQFYSHASEVISFKQYHAIVNEFSGILQ